MCTDSVSDITHAISKHTERKRNQFQLTTKERIKNYSGLKQPERANSTVLLARVKKKRSISNNPVHSSLQGILLKEIKVLTFRQTLNFSSEFVCRCRWLASTLKRNARLPTF